MATSQIASMLDELMGRNRNYDPNDENAKEIKWTDAEVCRYYLVQFCPHELFTNTKADLGPCNKIHDDDLKAKFQGDSGPKKTQYVEDFLRFCQRMLQDLSTRIKKAKERLLLTQEREERALTGADGGVGATGGINKEIDEKIILLSEKISALVQEAEVAGCSGEVEQAQGLLKLSDQLREERDMLRRTATSLTSGGTLKEDYAAQQKAMEVCEVCGAFLIVGDAQQRIDDHLLGKQHVGYARLRSAFERMQEERRKLREERDKELEDRRKRRDKESEERRKKRDRSRDRHRRRSRSRDRRDRSRDRRRRSRSRDKRSRRRSRSRDRRRSRSPRSRRDRSRDRRRSSRSRSRSRSRRDNRRSRSKSKEESQDS